MAPEDPVPAMAPEDPVPTVTLSATLTVSRLVTGLWQVADLERSGGLGLSPEDAVADLRKYQAAGLTTFDMADHYGSAELLMAGLPSATALTKWVPKPGAEAATAEAVDAAMQTSLQRLGREAIDLLQLHTWSYLDGPGVWLEQLRHVEAHPGVRNVGLTNFDSEHVSLALASGVHVVSNQICCSLLDRRFEGGMSTICTATSGSPKILAFGVLAGGLLTDRYLGRGPPSAEELDRSWSLAKYYRFIPLFGGWELFQELLRCLRGIADAHGVSIANVSTRWVLEHDSVASVIVGARLGHAEHISDNKKVFSFSLTDADRAAIEAVLGKATAIPGDCGDEYRRAPFLTASGDLSHHLDSIPPAFVAKEMPGHSLRRPVLAVSSGSVWEKKAGFQRAVRRGRAVCVSGTTATSPLNGQAVGATSAGAQATYALDLVEATLQAVGATLADVVRTRLYVRHVDRDWEAVAWAHGLRFRSRGLPGPANTLIEAALVGEEYLVEVEADAEVLEEGEGA